MLEDSYVCVCVYDCMCVCKVVGRRGEDGEKRRREREGGEWEEREGGNGRREREGMKNCSFARQPYKLFPSMKFHQHNAHNPTPASFPNSIAISLLTCCVDPKGPLHPLHSLPLL